MKRTIRQTAEGECKQRSDGLWVKKLISK